jgi:Phage tail tube protein
MPQRRAGLIQIKVNGEIYDAKGAFSFNLGRPKREAIIGADGVHGYKEIPQIAFIEGSITDRGTLDLTSLVGQKDATVVLDLGNDKSVVLGDAWYAGEGTGNTEEAEFPVRWEGKNAEEVPA